MVARKWLLGFALLLFIVVELILPIKGRAQLLSDTGLFYFTGTHRPLLTTPLFREYIPIGRGLKAGPVRFHPFLGVAGVYTDNVFRTEVNRRSDFLTTIAPGFQAYLPFREGQHSLLLDYRAAQFLYKEFTENNVLAQDAQGRVSLNFPVGLAIDLQGGHVEGFDPRGSELDIQARDITKWNMNTMIARAEYSGNRAGVRFRTNFADLHYKNNDQAPRRDRIRVTNDLTFFGKITPSISALLGAQISNSIYDENKQLDNFTYGAFTGFRLAPEGKISGEFNIGYTILTFDRAFEPDPSDEVTNITERRGSLKFLSMTGNLQWIPTSRLNIMTFLSRRVRNSAILNTGTYIQTSISLSARQALTERLGATGTFSFLNSDFDSGRLDNRVRWRMGMDYRTVKWLGFRLDYSFERRFSNQENFDFYSNTIMFSIEAFL